MASKTVKKKKDYGEKSMWLTLKQFNIKKKSIRQWEENCPLFFFLFENIHSSLGVKKKKTDKC